MTAPATAPCALSHPLPLPRWASETQEPPPSPGHPPHTLHCSAPSAGTHRAKTRETALQLLESAGQAFYPILQRGLEPCADPKLGRLLLRSSPPTRRSTPRFLWPFFSFALTDSIPQAPLPPRCAKVLTEVAPTHNVGALLLCQRHISPFPCKYIPAPNLAPPRVSH